MDIAPVMAKAIRLTDFEERDNFYANKGIYERGREFTVAYGLRNHTSGD